MEIIGYSERGIINSLFYEMKYSQKSIVLLNQFLSLVSFPYRTVNFQITDAKILIEQSFSDFGDADIVLLINNSGNKQAIFIEAKVRTAQSEGWSIEREFKKFREGIQQNKVSSSNLFTQLYHKLRLTQTLQSGGRSQLQEGVHFPKSSSKRSRKIGNNKVVLKAVDQLVPYCEDALFVALVPDDTSSLNNFYQKTLRNYRPDEFQNWEVENWGYVSWADIKEFCKKNSLENTLNVFDFNKGQIYDDAE